MARVYLRGNLLWLDYRDSKGRRVREPTGLPPKGKRAARAMLAERHHARHDRVRTRTPRLAEWISSWLSARYEEGKAVEATASRLRTHVVPALGEMRLDEVRPEHIRELVRQLRAGRTTTGNKLAPRTIGQVVRALRVVFRDAQVDEVLPIERANPVMLRKGDLPPMVDADPDFRARSLYSREEADRLISDPRVPPVMRMAFAILFLTGARAGELVALRWGDVHEMAPRWCLRIARSWQETRGREKSTKTGVVRDVPVHPGLLPHLLSWRDTGWPAAYGRAPRTVARTPSETDLVLPAPTTPGEHFGIKNLAAARAEVLRSLSMRPRRTHDTRRTFISLALADGAQRDRVKRLTHTRTTETFDQYTEIPWASLCEEVDKLRLAGWGAA
jgi:integrase